MTHIAIGMSYIKLLAEILNHYVLSFQPFFSTIRGVWYMFSNKFQFLNNITHILTHFFTHTYFQTCFQTIIFSLLSAYTKHPQIMKTDNSGDFFFFWDK